ncbi:MAG: hypothetical protein Q9174_000595 [Haloplaca sp. 1 TL-2023]
MDAFRLLSRSTKLHRSDTSTGAVVRQVPSAAEQGHLGEVPNSYAHPVESVSTGHKRKRSSSTGPSELRILDYATQPQQHGESRQTNGEGIDASKRHTASNIPDELDHDTWRRILKQNRLKTTLLSKTPESEEKRKHRHKRLAGRELGSASTKQTHVALRQRPLRSFEELGTMYNVSRRLLGSLREQGYKKPTEVQLGTLPVLLGNDEERGLPVQDNRDTNGSTCSAVDLLTVAPTGSGKTMAFMVPLIHNLMKARHTRKTKHEPACREHTMEALVLAPTHELVDQIVSEGKKLAFGTGIKITRMRRRMATHSNTPGTTTTNESTDGLLVDDEAYIPEIKADIMVSTPAMLLTGNTPQTSVAASHLRKVRYLVLDEADVLLDPLFREQTLDVWNTCTNMELQTTLWSATIGSSIEALAQSFILGRRQKLGLATQHSGHHIIRVVVGLKDSAIPNISHQLVYAATEPGKLMALRQLIHPTAATTLDRPSLQPPFVIFTQTIPRAIALHSELLYDISPEAGGSSRIAVLHSGLSDKARSTTMARFRKGEVWILITTDLLARGIDFRGINGVVNYDIPNTSGLYVHRVGRTGRQGRAGGVAVTLYTKEDIKYVKNIANVIAASEQQGNKGQGRSEKQGLPEWILNALPDVSKKAKRELKKGGVEERRATFKGDDGGKAARRMRISTKSGYDRRLEQRKLRSAAKGDSKIGSEDDWEGIVD